MESLRAELYAMQTAQPCTVRRALEEVPRLCPLLPPDRGMPTM